MIVRTTVAPSVGQENGTSGERWGSVTALSDLQRRVAESVGREVTPPNPLICKQNTNRIVSWCVFSRL
ncbi:hypothetical protein XFF6166_390002 [Xanthomonas citri pv. fuscans]|nr:hypothetical protein XFF6166_390002 [Xanthomonas citri pv. fuscans]SON99839.1 hypothetical protein XFF6960_210002 [Xanthomonas citri pv. fuscans]SOO03468.1 hypothetical protein XFF7767_160120 [Xanthomonas citri pv. fuscans]SOO10412.1 hypothetical protein XFF6970_570002 [Xanthomonas citri pv. fuscans]SOO15024.1 hypothetical protein XFF7766_470002 [Xanthomonas citri pv. fuscans]